MSKSNKALEKDWDSFYDRLDSEGARVYDFKGAKTTRQPTHSGSSYGAKTFAKCAHTHKPLKIGDYLIYGGSCSDPVVTDADVYVGFEKYGMAFSKKAYPWEQGYSFNFPITDGCPPDSVEDAGKLLGFLKTCLEAGKKVHIGCIGGHGRTGTILAALVCLMTGNKNAIEYVRTNYCTKAVETQSQIEWLHKHFGITKVTPSKAHLSTGRQGDLWGNYGSKGVSKTYSDLSGSASTTKGLFETVKPVRVKGNIWGF